VDAKTRKKVFRTVFRESAMHKFYLIYLAVFFVIALLVMITDKGIDNYPDAMWYCFVACTTIGFGDFTATGVISRLLTVALYLYTTGLLALTTAMFTQMFIEMLKARKNEAVSTVIYDLEHLTELSKEELEELSRTIKSNREFLKKQPEESKKFWE